MIQYLQPGCSTERHTEIKQDDKLYKAFTRHVGWQDLGDGTEFNLRACVVCGSTLGREKDSRPRQPTSSMGTPG